MNLVLSIPVLGQSGYEQLSREMAIALDKLGVIVHIEPKFEWNQNALAMEREERERLQRMLKQGIDETIKIVHQKCDGRFTDINKTRFCFTLFETNKCPIDWIKQFKEQCNEIWTFSNWLKNKWKMNSAIDVQVIPFSINIDVFKPRIEPYKFENLKGFNFISIGDWTERKNIKGLIKAYCEEFTNKDDVGLILKIHYSGFVERNFEEIRKKIRECVNVYPEHAPIFYIPEMIKNIDMAKLYNSSQCFVLPTRGEGLCLPAAEAMACELPVIISKWGGHLDFVNEDNGLLIEGEEVLINDLNYIRKCPEAFNHNWFEANIEDLKSKMRFAYENQELMKEKGKKGKKIIEDNYLWQNMGLEIIKRIKNCI